ncbi:MAG: Tol-Pal system beta propeller repeat protein TolB [Deltaproteobacteria bacterium]|nr:Tol-Pal system beta propeller repeat protein TolB [Deltaproteobacteria bacterium]
MTKIIITLTLTLLAVFCRSTQAKVYIDLSAPTERKLPIAIEEFTEIAGSGKEGDVKNALMGALKSDLNFSGLFNILPAALAKPSARSVEDASACDKWRPFGADALITGAYAIDNDSVSLEVKLFDCVAGKRIMGKKYIGSITNPGRLVHYFADQLYEELTGKKGIFSTKLLFVSGAAGNKELYVSDYDGKNVFRLTRNNYIDLSPRWSPDGTKALFVSYKSGWPCLYVLDLKTGKDSAISCKQGLNIGGAFSPDGNLIALTLSLEKDSSPELYSLDLRTGGYTRLTSNHGIDVSPSWSPDGETIAYTSDTSGNPHIFVLRIKGNAKAQRLTFDGKYNSSPAFSPDGKRIAYARADDGRFNVWLMDATGQNQTQLTFEGNNSNPSWSPDGRHIVFSSSVNGKSSLYIIRPDGQGLKKLTTGIGDEKTPAWSPFIQ